MELREQSKLPTLAQKLGDVTHVSPLLRKAMELSGCDAERVGEWLVKCAVERGASHYRGSFDDRLPPDHRELSDEEVGIGLCLAHHPFNPMFIRAAAQMLSAPGTDARALTRLAAMERCEPILLHIADAAERVGPPGQPWAFVRGHRSRHHHARTADTPQWSRFVFQTGYTPAGRGQHVEWPTRNE